MAIKLRSIERTDGIWSMAMVCRGFAMPELEDDWKNISVRFLFLKLLLHLTIVFNDYVAIQATKKIHNCFGEE